MTFSDKSAQFLRRLSKIYAARPHFLEQGPASMNEALAAGREEFYALAEAQLGKHYDPKKIEAVARLQRKLQMEQLALARRLESGSLKPEEYLALLTKAMRADSAACEAILGGTDFHRLFGVSASEAPNLIDRDTFLSQHR